MYRGMGRVCGTGEDPEFDNCSLGGGASSNWGRFLQDMIREGVSITRSVVTPPAVRRNADGSLQIRNSTPPATGGAGVGVGIPGWVWVAGGGALLLVALSSRRSG
jgi:hypothetical protein